MTLFLLTFFLVYGGAHLYLFAKIKAVLHPGVGAGIGLIILMVIMILAPIAVRITERYGYETLARFLSYTGYIWMGVLFLFFVSSLLFDFYRLLTYTGSLVLRRDLSHLAIAPVYAFMIPILISLGINTYGYFEAKNIRIEKITIKSSKIPVAVGRIRIVQMSDVHVGLIVRDERLQRIVDEVKKTDPDILVATGDLLDGQINRLEEPLAILREINPPYGKFAVTGNHEFFAGIDQALAFMKDAGLVVLQGEGLNVAGMINIAGVDDPTGVRFGLARPVSEKAMLSGLAGQYFTILLKHQPVVDNDAAGYFDLQISGHTHGGQIFPFNFVTKQFYPLNRGFFNLTNRSRLYVSRGAGTWGPPVRFLSPPEIAVIDLIYDEKTQ